MSNVFALDRLNAAQAAAQGIALAFDGSSAADSRAFRRETRLAFPEEAIRG